MASRNPASAQQTNNQQPGKVNNANLPSVAALIAAGINPKTGLPLKMGGTYNLGFKENNRKLLRIVDEQDAINRFTWYNLPNGLSSQLIERVLYYRGQGMFFYMEKIDQFYFLPYSLNGTIDVYGRFTSVSPLPFNGTADDGAGDKKGEEKKKNERFKWLTEMKRNCVYDIVLNELKIDDLLDSCVLLKDYTPQQSQTIISRQVLNDPLLDVMADCIPFLHTALLNATGVQGMRVPSEDEQQNVELASQSINHAALIGKKFIPIVGAIDFQELTSGPVAKSEEFLLTMQALDNYRLSLYGLENGGLFQKKTHMLEAEQNMNAGKASLVMQDGLTNRQNFCDVVNSIWGLGIECEISESALGIDRDMDGEIAEDDPQMISYESKGGTSANAME